MRNITENVKHLIIINVIMFIGTLAVGGGDLFYNLFALHYPENDNFHFWQILTHMFMHSKSSYAHIFFNMFALYMFGSAVEQVFGGKKFLFFYISSGLGAFLVTYLLYYIQIGGYISEISSLGLPAEMVKEILNLDIAYGNRFEGEILYNRMTPIFEKYNESLNILNEASFSALFNANVMSSGVMVGASGAIMGVLVAFGMLYPDSQLMLIFLPVPVKARYFIPGIIALDLISAITGQSFFSPSNTAYAAHVGGALTGFLLMLYFKKTQFNKNRWN